MFQTCHILWIDDKASWVSGQGDKSVCNMKDIQHISFIFDKANGKSYPM